MAVSLPMARPELPVGNATQVHSVADGVFDPSEHLAYTNAPSVTTMRDIGLAPTELSPVATTEPFPFLSREGVLRHRQELFSKEVLDNCLHQSRPGSVQLRGMAPRYSRFIHDFWHSPQVLGIISKIAGVDLVPALDYEICHTNIQLGPGGLEAVKQTPVEPPAADEETMARLELDKTRERAVADKSNEIVEWHKDSHPWVCVVMLSDARFMSGGETELVKGDGSLLRVRGPEMGSAVLLQGSYITHRAVPVTNMPERITIVTSFRPRNPMLRDETTNANVRYQSHLTELYYQWTAYRLDILAQRAQHASENLKRRYEENVRNSDREGKAGMCRVETVNADEIEQWAQGMIKYIQDTLVEMDLGGKETGPRVHSLESAVVN